MSRGTTGTTRATAAGEVLYETPRTRVVRRRPRPGDRAVIVKEFLGPGAGSRLHRERVALARLDALDGVPHLCAGPAADPDALVETDAGSVPLTDALDPDGWPVGRVLTLARDLVTVLAGLRQAGIVHHDVNPANVVLEPVTGRASLVDFDHATTLPQGPTSAPPSDDEISGTLPYLAPEQTGRMGRTVDHRADLYGLGATLYEVTSGRPPFVARDRLALVHAHLARVPEPLHQVLPGVPEALSLIVARLLEKEPDGRYQSAEGLAHDLSRLADDLAADREPDWPLGEWDFPARLTAPSRLIGRADELAVLDRAFDAAVEEYPGTPPPGGRGGVLVSGRAGVGKTTLIDHLRSRVVQADGRFVRGSADRNHPDRPAMTEALRALGRMLLAEQDTDLLPQRTRILEALGPNVDLVVTLPEFALLFRTPAVAPEALESCPRERLTRAWVDLLRAVASPQRPLVVALDDLQWASQADLEAVDTLLSEARPPGLLVVCSFRNDELDPGHPLTALRDRWERLDRRPPTVPLGNLPEASLAEFLGAMLRLPVERTAPLAQAIAGHTRGNPAETIDLVDALRRDGILRPGRGGWQWDADRIRRYVGSADAATLLVARIERLPALTRELLPYLVCLGGRAPLARLATAAGHPVDQVRAAIVPAVDDGLLDRCAGGHEPGPGEPEDPTGAAPGTGVVPAAAADARPGVGAGAGAGAGTTAPVDCQADDAGCVGFSHERVRLVVEGLLDERRLRGKHLEVARRLAAAGDGDPVAADQYLVAADELTGPSGGAGPTERHRVAALFRRAAAATRLVDPARAERFLARAEQLLAGVPAGTDDALAAAVAVDRHALLYELGRLGEADTLYARIVRDHTDPLELTGPVCVQIASLTNRSRAADAVTLGLDLLRRLGMPVPVDVRSSIHRGLEEVTGWVSAVAAQDRPEPGGDGTGCGPVASDGPVATELSDVRLLAAARVMQRMLAPALVADPSTHPWLTLAAQRIWADVGASGAVLATAGGAPGFLIALRDDFDTAYALARLTVKVGNAYGWEPAASIVRCQYAAAVGHWFEPVEDQVDALREVRDRLVRSGEPQFVGLAYQALLPALLDRGPTLDTCEAELDAALDFAARTGSRHDEGVLVAYRQLLRCLRGETSTPGGFDDDSFVQAAHLADPQVTPAAQAVFHVNRALAALLFGDVEALAEHSRAAERRLTYVPGYYVTALTHLLRALALADRLRADPVPAPDALAEFDRHRDWLGRRAKDAPDNFAHLMHLLDAERARATGDDWDAARCYDRAFNAIPPHARPWHTAFIAERTGEFLLAMGLSRVGGELLARACTAYEAWGATAKTAQLEERSPRVRQLRIRPERASRSAEGPVGSGGGDAVDLLGVFRASQAIARETSLDRLRERLAEVVGELAGATDVHILVRTADSYDWSLLRDGSDPASLGGDRSAELVPMSAVRFAERTQTPLLVPDALRDSRFARDPYLAGIEHCSLMVVPVLSQGELRGMLVLENRLSRDVFTPARLCGVELITGQLTVTLDNALAERFRSLVRRSSDATVVCARDGLLNYASPAAGELFGEPEEGLVGRPLAEFVHPDDRQAVTDRVKDPRAVPEPLGDALQCRTLRPDGESRWVEITFTDLTADPAVSGVVLHLRDVTERRRLESQLRHAHKMESVGQLAAGLAHEINTPIQFVGDNLKFLAEAFEDLARVLHAYRDGRADRPADDVAAEVDLDYLLDDVPAALTQTREGVDRVATIVRAMKASAHPGGEGIEQVPLNEVVRSTLVIAHNELKYVADVELELDELPDLWCNRGDLNQVVLNLVVNAAQAISESVSAGAVRGRLAVRTRCEGDEAVLEIEDTGAGIPPEVADRIFEPFFTTKGVGTGTGQGLSLAYYLIHDRHGGSITFSSRPGEGTTFTVRIPVGVPPAPATGAVTAAPGTAPTGPSGVGPAAVRPTSAGTGW